MDIENGFVRVVERGPEVSLLAAELRCSDAAGLERGWEVEDGCAMGSRGESGIPQWRDRDGCRSPGRWRGRGAVEGWVVVGRI